MACSILPKTFGFDLRRNRSRLFCYVLKQIIWLCSRAEYLPGMFYILFYPITLEGRRGTTDEFATITFHLVLFSAALVELANSIPVRSLILSSHLFFCLPLFLCPFTVPCRTVFPKPEDLERWPNHLSFRFLTSVRCSYILQWPPGSFCEPPHWSHGPCMNCSIVSGSIQSQMLVFVSLICSQGP